MDPLGLTIGGAVVLLNDDAGSLRAHHSITDSVISDSDGFGLIFNVAGGVSGELEIADTRVEDIHFVDHTRNSGFGIIAAVYETAEIALTVKGTSVERTQREGIVLVTGFLGSAFFPPGIIPVSDATIDADIDSYHFVGVGPEVVNNQNGIELLMSDLLNSAMRVRMRNSDITGASLWGLETFAPWGARDFTFDSGCVNVDDPATTAVETCEDLGLEPSPGNNRIFDNGLFFGGREVDLVGPVTGVSQGNWWGDPAGLGDCVQVPFGAPLPIGTRCHLLEIVLGFGEFDARYHLTEDPRP